MRVVIIGASGFIGRGVYRNLASSGYEVVALTRNPEKTRRCLGEKSNLALWDGGDASALRPIIDGADAVVNLAGENISGKRWNPDFKESIRQSRVGVGRCVVQAIEGSRAKPSVLIQASAVGYYGSRGSAPLDEHFSPGDDFLSEICREWEASTVGVEKMGVRRAIIRTGVVLAEEGGALPRLVAPFRFFMGGHLGNGRQWFPWIHYEDEIRAIRFLIENDSARDAFNLTAPEPIMLREFCGELGRALNRPSWVPVPSFALRAALGEMAEQLLLTSQRAVPKRLLEMGFEFSYPSVGSALSEIFTKQESQKGTTRRV